MEGRRTDSVTSDVSSCDAGVQRGVVNLKIDHNGFIHQLLRMGILCCVVQRDIDIARGRNVIASRRFMPGRTVEQDQIIWICRNGADDGKMDASCKNAVQVDQVIHPRSHKSWRLW